MGDAQVQTRSDFFFKQNRTKAKQQRQTNYKTQTLVPLEIRITMAKEFTRSSPLGSVVSLLREADGAHKYRRTIEQRVADLMKTKRHKRNKTKQNRRKAKQQRETNYESQTHAPSKSESRWPMQPIRTSLSLHRGF